LGCCVCVLGGFFFGVRILLGVGCMISCGWG